MKRCLSLLLIGLLCLLLIECGSKTFETSELLYTSLEDQGKVITSVGGIYDRARALAIQLDGKIVVAGSADNASNDDFAVVRYNIDGSLDTSFGNQGKVITPVGNKNDDAYALAIQRDGKIIVAGQAFYANTIIDYNCYGFALVRYNIDGFLDTSFGDQ